MEVVGCDAVVAGVGAEVSSVVALLVVLLSSWGKAGEMARGLVVSRRTMPGLL